MTTFMTSGSRPQVLVDEAQLQQLQAEARRGTTELERLKTAMETLNSVNVPAHFMAAAMALCNELASRWQAERAAIGFLRGRYVRLLAMSHTEKITRHMQLVQDIEASMEECLDQDIEIIYPPTKDAAFVYRSTETLATRQTPYAVVSLPLRRPLAPGAPRHTDERFGDVVAVLTVERKADQPFTVAEIETLRLTADLFTSRLVDLYEHDRWIGAKAARGTRRVLSWVLGAKHTWAKAIAIAVAAFLAFAFFVNGTYKIEAPFVFETAQKQIIGAPFDGFLKSVHSKIGDMVFTSKTAQPFDDLDSLSPLAPIVRVPHPATILAILKTDELVSKLNSAQAEYATHHQDALGAQAEVAKGNREKQGDVLIAQYQMAKAQAEVTLIEYQISQAEIHAPIDGIIFSGELDTKDNAPVKTGDELYQIGQPELLRAELSVPEDQVSELKINQIGILKATSYPDRPIHFTVERITPIASVSGQKNVFKVRVRIDPDDIHLWMRPGMEGLAKVDVESARYAWIWTHRLINWVRMKLWM